MICLDSVLHESVSSNSTVLIHPPSIYSSNEYYCYDNPNLSQLSNCLSRQHLPFYPAATATVSMATTLFLRGDRPARQEPVGFRMFPHRFLFSFHHWRSSLNVSLLPEQPERSESNQTGTFLSSTLHPSPRAGNFELDTRPNRLFFEARFPEFCGHPRQMQLLLQFIVQYLYDISDFLGI